MADRVTQGGTAHSKAKAEEWARGSIRLANGPADDLIARTMASVGPGSWGVFAMMAILLLPPAVAVNLPIGATRLLAAFVCVVVGSVITTRMMTRMQHPVYLTITRDELICYCVPKMTQQPARADVLFRASPRAVRVKGRKDKKGQNWTIRFVSRGPGVKGRPQQHRIRAWFEEHRLRLAFQRPLTVDRSWYRELGEVMTALQASGAQVQPALLDITAP